MVGLKQGEAAYEWARLDALKHHPDNPRKGNVDVIRESLRANGIIRPIVVSRATRHVLAGNHTLKAARAEGMEALPVVWLDGLTPAQERKVLLADNRTSDLGTYDAEVLAAVLGQMREEDELLGTGYSDADAEALIAGVAMPSDEDLEDAFGALPDGDKSDYETMSFTLHRDQAEAVRDALEQAKAQGPFVGTGNENSNGNALARIVEAYRGR